MFFTLVVDSSDIKASVAALAFVLRSAAKFDVEDSTLSNELQQLGPFAELALNAPTG